MLNLSLKFDSAAGMSVFAGLLGVAALGALSGVAQTGGTAGGEDQVKTQSTPYYCRVKALDKAEWAQLHALAAKVSGARSESKELPDGYAFRLRSDQVALGELGEWTGYVHRCCPFLDYEIAVQRDGALWVTIKGGEAAKPFIRSEFARLFVEHPEGEEMRKARGSRQADSKR
jgi:hypothetical protein